MEKFKKFIKYFIFSMLVKLIMILIFWVFKTFVVWEFSNPVQFIIDIPKYTNDERSLILFSYIIFDFFICLPLYQLNKKNQINEKD